MGYFSQIRRLKGRDIKLLVRQLVIGEKLEPEASLASHQGLNSSLTKCPEPLTLGEPRYQQQGVCWGENPSLANRLPLAVYPFFR